MTPWMTVRELGLVSPTGVTLLSGFNLELHPGQLAVLSDASGAGKSSLLRALIDADAMRAEGWGVTEGSVTRRGRVAHLRQPEGLFDFLDTAANLRFVAPNATAVERKAAWVDAALDDVCPDQRGGLSAGQRKRVALARVFAVSADVYLLDEPFAGLDEPRCMRLIEALRERLARGAAVVMVTHRPELVRGLDCYTPLSLPKTAPAQGSTAWPRRLRLSAPLPLQALGVLGRALRLPEGGSWTAAVVLCQVLRRSLSPWVLALVWVTSWLLGLSVTLALTKLGEHALSPQMVFDLLRNRPLKMLFPPLGAWVFAATSAASVGAWGVHLRRSGQLAALRGMRRDPDAILLPTAWVGLALSGFILVGLFGLGMWAGTWTWATLGVTLSADPKRLLQGLWFLSQDDLPSLARAVAVWATSVPIVATIGLVTFLRSGEGEQSDEGVLRGIGWSTVGVSVASLIANVV